MKVLFVLLIFWDGRVTVVGHYENYHNCTVQAGHINHIGGLAYGMCIAVNK